MRLNDTEWLKRICTVITPVLLLSACSMGQVVVRVSGTILDGGIEAMNRETDLELAREAIPANLKLIEGMLIEDPQNTRLRLFAAEGFYGYAYGFIEDSDRSRAMQLYRRCYEHARQTLMQTGLSLNPESTPPAELESAVSAAGRKAVPALFWSASCLAKWIDMNRTSPAGLAELSSAAILMQRVLELDEQFYHGGAHLFFGVYYGGRAPLFGGDFARSRQHFARAAEINDNKLLLTDLLYAEFLARQQLDQTEFHQRLTRIIEAPVNLYPEMALANAIARQKGQRLLGFENDWF